MHFTKVQISELMRKHAEKENGLHDMMVAERSEFLHENPQNKGNGYRFGHAYGQGRKLEFRIPRDAASEMRNPSQMQYVCQGQSWGQGCFGF